MIKKIYETKDECVSFFVNSEFECFPSDVLTYPYGDFEYWGRTWDDDSEDKYGYVDIPMWTTWFLPSRFVEGFIDRYPEKVADCGFTIIYETGTCNIFALGVDGAGYSFLNEHFRPLYDAMGLKWHDED